MKGKKLLMIIVNEYDDIEEKLEEKLKEKLKEKILNSAKEPKDNPEYLGLHLDSHGKLKVSHFVGIARIKIKETKEVILIVKPKIETINVAKMLSEVLSHRDLGKRKLYGKKGMYYYKFDEPPLSTPIDGELRDNFLFMIMHYINILYEIVKKGLQRGYAIAEGNLRNRVRGRILIGKNIKNTLKARKHYVYCFFNLYTQDILENKILKAAFLKGIKRINTFSTKVNTIPQLAQRIAFINSNTENISLSRIFPSDFQCVMAQRIRPDYKLALDMAKRIFKTLGYDAEKKGNEKVVVYPYWIDMNELFERYCEVKLRNKKIPDLAEYEAFPCLKNIKTDVGELRPDFILVGKNGWGIADAKYKPKYQNEWIKEDLQQIALYGRFKWEYFEKWGCIKEWCKKQKLSLNNLKNIEPHLYILYPERRKEKEAKEKAEKFANIYKIGVFLP